MHKSIRLFALLAVMTLVSSPALQAEQMGTNPHPQVTKAAPGTWAAFVDSVRSYLGL